MNNILSIKVYSPLLPFVRIYSVELEWECNIEYLHFLHIQRSRGPTTPKQNSRQYLYANLFYTRYVSHIFDCDKYILVHYSIYVAYVRSFQVRENAQSNETHVS